MMEWLILKSDEVIVCELDLFRKMQGVICGNETTYVPTEMLYKTINEMCYSKKVYNVHFFGNKEYIDGIVSEMYADEMTHYSKNRITVEIN